MTLLWLKAFHIIAVICWFAMLFYLPRLFVYHAMADDETGRERFKVMERKLYRGIGTPAMLVSLALGLAMIFVHPGYLQMHWMQAKLGLVVLMIIYHFMCGAYIRAFAENRNQKSHRYFRFFNEAPVLVLIPIILLVVIKPLF